MIKLYLIMSVVFSTCFLNLARADEPDLNTALAESAQNTWNWPALHYAIEMDYKEAARVLIVMYSNGINDKTPPTSIIGHHSPLNSTDAYYYKVGTEEGMTALDLALRKGNTELALDLLELGADSQDSRKEYNYKISLSWINRQWIRQEERVKNVSSDNFIEWAYNYQITTSLYWAILAQDVLLIEKLLATEPHLSCVFERHEPVWHPKKYREDRLVSTLGAVEAAAKWGSDEVIKKILQAQNQRYGTLDFSDSSEIPDEMVAIFKRHAGEDLNCSMLFSALRANDIEAFELMLQFGLSPHVADLAGESLIVEVLRNPDASFASILGKYI